MRLRNDQYVSSDERDKILDAIEQQAKSLSSARGSVEGQRLSDWLNAAEDVMPEIKKPTVKPMSLSNKAATTESTKSMSSQNLMGIVAAGTVVLGLAIGGGFAYMQIMQKMSELDLTSQQLADRLSEFEKAIKDVQQSDGSKMVGISADGQVQAVPATNHSVSAEYLDAKLQAQTDLLSKGMEEKLRQLLERIEGKISSIPLAPLVEAPLVGVQASQPAQVVVKLPVPQQPVEVPLAMTAPVSTAAAPTPIAAVPTISAPVVPVVQPPAPVAPQAPVVVEPAASADQAVASSAKTSVDGNAWLAELNPESLVLQLGSSPKMDALEPTIRKIRSNPEMAHVLLIKANGTQRYILVFGSFDTREDAKKAADQVRVEMGVTAWMRKAGDVKALLDRQ